MASNAFGIDLGTNNIKIYSRSDDHVLVEKNMIAIENKKVLFAYGNSAFEMYEKAPGNIHISYPLSNGVIADIKNMETLVRYFITGLQKGIARPAEFYIAVPTDVTEVEKRAFYDLVKDANVKAKKIMVVEKAVANASMDIPEPMLEAQIQTMVNDSARRMQSQGMSLSQYMQFTGMTVDQLKNQARPQAERSIRTRLVLEAVAKAENLQVSEEKLNEEIENMAKAYGMDAAQARERMGEAGLEQMKEDLAVQEAVDFLVAEAKLV